MKVGELAKRIGYDAEVVLVITEDGIKEAFQKGVGIPPAIKAELVAKVYIEHMRQETVRVYRDFGQEVIEEDNCLIV
ncbi:MAG: hypothetical protein GF350_04910 [Chitinivibrionales bacterium]|nr:hypothetical protein [Chitinivibrionales bacterium]